MANTVIDQLAAFTAESEFAGLPRDVVEQSKRVLLDSLGCALGAIHEPKGRIGIDYGRMIGTGRADATIIGASGRVSIFGACFANAELINTLDADVILPPGHVTPYVLPGALAIAESSHRSGPELITAIAVSHEISYRLGRAMDYQRDIEDGTPTPPQVYGYSSAIFGATAAIGCLKRLARRTVADSLGIAGGVSPVNAHRAWMMHTPGSTIKYLLGGVLAQSAMTASHMAELGHRGDLQTLDDPEFGYRRYIGTKRWAPDQITDALGSEWWFPSKLSFKFYPHCRTMHAQLDALMKIIEDNNIMPEEIDGITAWGEGFVEQPIWLNREINHVMDAQFSMAHGLALAAHRLPYTRAWQAPENVWRPSVLALMDKVVTAVHPDYVKMLTSDPASRPARVEVKARGETFLDERIYPKGTPSPDPATYMTNDELIGKFCGHADEVLAPETIERVVDTVMNLEDVRDLRAVMGLLTPREPVANAVERSTAS